jgi:diacylglycerol O-acyltransferase / wax synthase
MPAARLSALDASFLAVETPTAHMHVGWAAVFDPPEGKPQPTFEELRDHIASRLDRAPRYRQRLAFVPFGLHDPVWVDDDRFDIDHHVLPAPWSNLDQVVAMAMSAPLERSRPLWECWIAPRLDDGRIGLVGKAHHCMVDGLAAVEMAVLLLDPTPDPDPLEPAEWEPEPAPGPVARLAQGLADRALHELTLVGLPTRLASSPGRLAGDLRNAATALLNSFLPLARPAGALNEELSSLRHLARFGRPIEDLLLIKSHFDTTLNDVVLAACSGAMRRFLEERGEHPFRLKAMVPVALRASEDAGTLGNRLSFLFIELPTDEADPVDRLRAVNRVTSERKTSGEPEGGDTVLKAIGHTPHVVQRALTRLVASPRTFNLVVSNIPGPREPLWMGGCELRESYPVVPLAERHTLSIGVTSVRDGLFFGLYADRKSLPDADALARHVDEAIDELLERCPEPGGDRRDGGPPRRRERRGLAGAASP